MTTLRSMGEIKSHMHTQDTHTHIHRGKIKIAMRKGGEEKEK